MPQPQAWSLSHSCAKPTIKNTSYCECGSHSKKHGTGIFTSGNASYHEVWLHGVRSERVQVRKLGLPSSSPSLYAFDPHPKIGVFLYS